MCGRVNHVLSFRLAALYGLCWTLISMSIAVCHTCLHASAGARCSRSPQGLTQIFRK
jgi:hypothetical protein